MLFKTAFFTYHQGIARYKSRNTQSISGPTSLHINYCVAHLALAFVRAFIESPCMVKKIPWETLFLIAKEAFCLSSTLTILSFIGSHIFSWFFGLFTLLILYMPDHRARLKKSLTPFSLSHSLCTPSWPTKCLLH